MTAARRKGLIVPDILAARDRLARPARSDRVDLTAADASVPVAVPASSIRYARPSGSKNFAARTNDCAANDRIPTTDHRRERTCEANRPW